MLNQSYNMLSKAFKSSKGILTNGGSSIVQKTGTVGISASLFTYENISHGDYLQPRNFTTTANAIRSFLYSKVKCK